MIKANKKIGVVYCANSKKYVEELCNIITIKKDEGYLMETVVVDDDLDDPERMIDERVFANLDKCDYGIIFLTKDLKIGNDKYVSRPNVLVEYGYLRGRLEKNHIWCITDFPHKDIEDKKYIIPSDFVAEIPEEIDENNYKSDLKKIIDKFIKVNYIIKLDNYNANNLVNSLILNTHYKTDYEMLFSFDMLAQINKYSLKFQQEEIVEMWINEKGKLEDAEQVVYLFERMVFLPFFPEKVKYNKLQNFLSIKNREDNGYIYACCRILKDIIEYEDYKRARQSYESHRFYSDKACEIDKSFSVLGRNKVAPIIECVTQNYLGLCYLNSYIAMQKTAEDNQDCGSQKGVLEKAQKCFSKVIQLSEKNFSDKMEIFQAFAKYNMARVIRNQGKDAESEYYTAINKRKSLSKSLGLPEIFRLNFALEKIHAEIDYCDYIREKGKISSEDYDVRINNLRKELEDIKKTPAADVSLFKSLEDKLSHF